MYRHNHATRVIQPKGKCPACDQYRMQYHGGSNFIYESSFNSDLFLETFILAEMEAEIAASDITTPDTSYATGDFGGTSGGDFGGDGGSF